MRLGFLRVYQESNAFSTRPTTREAFERFGQVLRGEALTAHVDAGQEMVGYLDRAEYCGFRDVCVEAGVEPVPLLSLVLHPSGPMTAATVAWILDEVRRALAAGGPLDGVVLALHGAARGEGGVAVDPEVLRTVVAEVGPDLPIVAVYDMHVNLNEARRSGLVTLVAYHTNPHRDVDRTAAKATRILLETMRGQLRPTTAWRKLPVILGGGAGVDVLPPFLSLTLRVRLAERRRAVVDVSLCISHPFADDADLGWAVHVTTHDDRALAEELAEAFADRLWAVRTVPIPPMYPIPEAVDRARRSRLARATGVVSLVDTADVVAAGAPGDNTQLLDYLSREAPDLRVILPILDEAAVDALWDRPSGTRVTQAVGAGSVTIDGRIVGQADRALGRGVVVDTGPLKVVLSDMPPVTISPMFYLQLGLDLFDADAVVQKSFLHYLWQWPRYHRRAVPFLGDGATSLDKVRRLSLSFAAYPVEDPPDWRDHDRSMRA